MEKIDKKILTDEDASKGGKWEEKSTTKNKNMLFLRWYLNAKLMQWGGININRKISLYFFTENINSEFYINILKEKRFPKWKLL